MRQCLCFILTVCVWTAATVAGRSSPSDFRSMAAIQGDFTPDTPVCVPLSREVIAGAKRSFADLRVFDDQGQEVPYVIYEQTEAHRMPKSFAFKIISYDDASGPEKITVQRPNGAPAFWEIELEIAGKDFKKRVRVEAGPAPDAMEEIATDTIFDFSSRLDLRKTAITLPQTDAAFLRIVLEDDSEPQAGSPAMRLRYDGLEFWTDGMKAGPFRVNRILGRTGQRKLEAHYFDHITITEPQATIDEDGNSVICINGKLPVAYMTFDVDNPYYYRRVQLLTADEDRDEECRPAGDGIIYKMPGVAKSKNTIRVDKPPSYLRLRVFNEDNPPLRIRSISIAWVRRNLFFVPESGRTYSLYLDSDVVELPRYELLNLIPSDHARLKRYTSMSVSGLRPNPSYDPRMKQSTRETVEKAVFIGLMVIIVCVLAVWAFRLLKKMPVQVDK